MTQDTKSTHNLITHNNTSETQLLLSNMVKALKKKANLALPLAQEITLLNELSEFELGRFLLKNKGLNGYWTSYIIIHGPKYTHLHPLEKWILNSAPTVKATQERFRIFQKILQQNLTNNIHLASIPCGLMEDLYLLDYTKISEASLTGIDLDPDSITIAKNNAIKNQNLKITLHIKDAWNLSIESEYNIITSNGLNVYEPNDENVIKLYKEFYKALKPNGILITSFLTPPPSLSKESTWTNVNQDDLIKQKAILSDIIDAKWQTFRTEKETKDQLQKAGFQNIVFIYDTQKIFPTVTVQKL